MQGNPLEALMLAVYLMGRARPNSRRAALDWQDQASVCAVRSLATAIAVIGLFVAALEIASAPATNAPVSLAVSQLIKQEDQQ
jgi:hypothetical protein